MIVHVLCLRRKLFLGLIIVRAGLVLAADSPVLASPNKTSSNNGEMVGEKSLSGGAFVCQIVTRIVAGGECRWRVVLMGKQKKTKPEHSCPGLVEPLRQNTLDLEIPAEIDVRQSTHSGLQRVVITGT